MLYIFAALLCEVRPLIEKYDMKPCGGYPFGGFVSADERVRITITGVGKTNAAAAVAYVCAECGVGPDDFVINIGTAAGGAARHGAYLINKVIDSDTGRTYYPDMLYNTGLRESCVTTVSNVATPDITASDGNMLWEMEASGFCDAARLFMPPHRVQLIKAVSDGGADDKEDLTEEVIVKAIEDSLEDIIRALEVYKEIREETLASPVDTGAYAGEFKCSETMRQDLNKFLIYCRNSGRDAGAILEEMRSEGLIPASDRRGGKEALNEFKRRVLQ